MGVLKKAESALADAFKDLPQFPDNTKEGLAKVWPWLALIGGILQLFGALALWRVASYADHVNETLSLYYTEQVGPTSFQKTVIYIGVATLLVEAVLLLMAFPKLKQRLRAGWDLLFLAAMLNVGFGVLQIFTFNRGFSNFIGSLIGSALGFYLLFQVREKFSKGAGSAPRQPSKQV